MNSESTSSRLQSPLRRSSDRDLWGKGSLRALVKGHYRFIDQPSRSAITPESMLAPHRERTLRRMHGEQVVLCVQGGADLHFAEHPGGVGLGLIARNLLSRSRSGNAKGAGPAGGKQWSQGGRKEEGSEFPAGEVYPDGTLGLHMHSTLAVNTAGIPLGVPQIQLDVPDGKAERGKPLQERKTMRWIRGVRECGRLAGRLPGTRVVSVMDREGDVFAVFAEGRRLQAEGVELLVRARHNRSRGKGRPKLFEHIRARKAQAELQLDVARSSARRSTRSQARKDLREARRARAELRWKQVEIQGPGERGQPLRLQLVHVWERSAPAGKKALEWYLLTSLEVECREDAERVLDWYGLRCRIEDWHRILRAGCKVEYLGRGTRERMERAVTTNAVIAWRLAAMTLLGRETPEMPAEVFYTDLQLRVLRHFALRRGMAEPVNLGLAVRTMAILGGYLYRRNGPPAGPQKIWEGWTRLTIMAEAYELRDSFGRSQTDSQHEP